MKKRSLAVLVSIMLLALVSMPVLACTDILVGKSASTDGSVITSHTCDGRYDSRIQIIPAADHKPGEMAPVYEWIVYGDRKELVKLGEIPQAEHTYKYFHAAYPFANEHQVIIGETTLGGAKQTANSDKAIMTIEQLEIYALQRTTNARDAVKLMGELAVKYGYRESCNLGECLTVSDPYEVWVFEVFGVGPLWTPESGEPGAVWAAQRVPDDHVTCVPNYSMIGQIDPNDKENFMFSENYISTAVELGLYDPAKGEPFVWKYAYGNIKGKTSSRLWRVYSTVAPSGNWEFDKTDSYPFSIKPEKKVSVFEVMEMYRDVMTDTPYDMGNNEKWYYTDSKGNKVKSTLANPQASADQRTLLGISNVRNIAVTGCSYYFVSQARSWMPNPVGGVMWFGLDNPHKGLFIPMYVGCEEVPTSWSTLNRDIVDRTCSYWAFETVDRISSQNYGTLMPLIEKVRKPMQESINRMQKGIENTAMQLYVEDPALARQLLTTYTYSLMLKAEKAYYDLGDTLLLNLRN